MKIVTVIGTRPEIIKMSPVVEMLDKNFDHTLIHTGQHYDANLNQSIFDELKLKRPNLALEIVPGSFGTQLPDLIQKLEAAFKKIKPDHVIVQGDTNSAMAGALVASRMKINVIHVESGCRSGNPESPEEQNRKIIDSISGILLCSDKESKQHLKDEGKMRNAFLVGSTTFDALTRSLKLVKSGLCESYGLKSGKYALATIHRAENTDQLEHLRLRMNFLNKISEKIPLIFPVHPRTRDYLDKHKIILSQNIIQIKPLSHLPFLSLLQDSYMVLTDSGGIQEEAAFLNRPCLVLRKETEWKRYIKDGKNFLLKNLDKKDEKVALKLISDKKTYEKCVKKRPSESSVGSVKKIQSILKKLK
jgi:UDP-N-acetylglucosamine 2-epimerase